MREHRNKLGLSLNDLAKKIGVTAWELNNWERGKSLNSPLFKSKIDELCEALFAKQEDLNFPNNAPALKNPKVASKTAPADKPKLNETVKVAMVNTPAMLKAPNLSESAPASVKSLDELIRVVKELQRVSKKITVNFNITVNSLH